LSESGRLGGAYAPSLCKVKAEATIGTRAGVGFLRTPFTTGQNCAQFCLRLHELRAFRNSVQHARSGDYLLRPAQPIDNSTGSPHRSALVPDGRCFMIERNLGSESCSDPASRTLPALGGKMSMFERSESDILVRRAARSVDSWTVKRDMKHRNDETVGYDPIVRQEF